jgi:hypothetical protein
MPFKRANKNEDHLPASQREDTETDTEGQGMRFKGAKNEDYLPPAEREATDDGSDDTEGQGRFRP